MASWRELLWGKNDKGLHAVKQLVAGAVENTVANTSESGGYRPAIVDTPGAIAEIISQATGTQFKSKAARQFLENSLRRAQLGTERTNKTLGTHNPQNTDELALRVAGSLAVPAPKGAAAAKYIPKRVVAAAKAVPKAVTLPAKVAAEVMMPLRQTSVKTAAPIAAGITGAIDVVTDGMVDPSTGQKYEGTLGDIIGVDSDTPIEEVAPHDEIDQLMLDTALETGDITDPDELLAAEITDEEVILGEEQDKLSRFEGAALAIGAAISGSVALKYADDFLKARTGAATAPDNIGKFTGKKFHSSRLKGKDKIVTELFEQDRPVRNMAEEHLGREYAEQWGFKADAMTNASIQSRVRSFFETGRAPGAPMRSTKLAPLAQAYAKELSPDEQKTVSDALLAASALDDYKQTGVLAAMTKDAAGNPIGPKQLEMLVQSVTTNPKLSKYYNSVQKSFDDLAKYRVMRGRDTMEGYRELRDKRPNYVPFNRNFDPDVPFSLVSQRYSANADQGLGASRNLEEAASVSGSTGIGNPFVSLFDEWANEIRRSELNELRADFLTKMEAAGAKNAKGRKIVEAVTPTTKDENVHTVRVGGRQMNYRVNDPEVARALHFSPRKSVHALEMMRQAQQNLTTGPLATLHNFFAITAAPVFDSMAASVLSGKGNKIGAANRAFIGGHVGALRYLWDDMRGNMARTLRDNVIRENSWLKTMVGEKNLANLATQFENAYENSIKADLDAYGITSHTMHGSPDPSQLMLGMEEIAPDFARATQRALRDDIGDAAVAGDLGPLRAALATSKSAFAQAKTNSIIRAYTSVMEAMHNGARYTAYAANKGKQPNLPKLVSDMRRLSADSSKHGASDALNIAVGANMYAPIAMQTMFELGRRFRESPSTMLMNTITTSSTAAALLYTSLAYDEEALQRHMAKTPSQKATSLSLFGGMELKLDPIMRLTLAPILPILDNLSGLNEGNFNPNFVEVMKNWLDGSAPDFDEKFEKDLELRVKKGLQDNYPISLSSFPIATGIVAAMGVDPGMSRMTGEAVLPRTQELTGMETDVRRPNALVSAQTENMISAIFSTAGRSTLQMADDAYRALKGGGDNREAMERGLEAWKGHASRSAGILKPIFGEYPSVESASDINYELMKDREPGIEQAIKVYNADYRGEGLTGVTNKKAERLPVEENVPKPEIEGTQLAYISEMAQQLNNMFLNKNREVLGRLGKEVEAFGAQQRTTQKSRTLNINEINKERRYQRMMMLTQTEEYERQISERLGRTFTFEDFNPDEYLIPLAPEN